MNSNAVSWAYVTASQYLRDETLLFKTEKNTAEALIPAECLDECFMAVRFNYLQ